MKLDREVKDGTRGLGVITMFLDTSFVKKKAENRGMILGPPLHTQLAMSTYSEIRKVWV